MILLTSTSDKLQIVTSSSANLDVHASFYDNTNPVTPDRQNTAISSPTTTDVVAAPSGSNKRNVQTLIVRNRHASTANDVTVKHTDGSTTVELCKTTLAAGETLSYIDGAGFSVVDALGQIKTGVGVRRVNIQAITATGAGTYTPTAGMKYCIVIATGGGGGGGGADTSAGGSGDVGVGAGGGAGGTAIGFFDAATIGASQAVNVGTGGNGGSNAGGDGTAGGNTTFGSTLLTGNGGALGAGSGSSAQDAQARAGGTGGSASGGTLNIPGGDGDDGVAGACDGTTDLVFGRSGAGGASFWGGGGRGRAGGQSSLTTDLTAAGVTAAAYGAGGSGAFDLTSTTGVTGGDGKAGVIMVIEFI